MCVNDVSGEYMKELFVELLMLMFECVMNVINEEIVV